MTVTPTDELNMVQLRERREVLKAKGPVGTVVADLGAVATSMANGAGFGNGGTSPESQVIEAMREQGMSQQGAFGPGQPMNQFFPRGAAPWQWDRPTGYNIASRPRATESRIGFATLRSMYENYDVARMCIEHRQDDVRALDWNLIARDGKSENVDAALEAGRRALKKPDGSTPFDSWLSAWLEDVLKYDAGALYKRRTRDGKVSALEVVDGTTIAPLLDYEGRRPRGDAPAFVQYVVGVPGVWLYDADLVYQPFRMQTNSPYGLAPMEYMLLNSNTDLRFQWHFLQYFTEGNVPEGFMDAPPDASSPEQIEEFQAAWDAVMEGDTARKRQIRWVPSGSKYTAAKDSSFEDTFPLFMLRKTCAAHKVKPTDLGFTDDANRSTSDVQDDVARRIGRKPLLTYVQGVLDSYLQDDLGLPVAFRFDTGEEKEDRLAQAQEWKVWIEAGVASVDEPREKILGLPVDPANPVPRFVLSRSGPEPLRSIMAIGGDSIDPETMSPEAGSVTYLEDIPAAATADIDENEIPGKDLQQQDTAKPAETPEPLSDKASSVTKADADLPVGAAMVALMLPSEVAQELALEDGVPATDMHVTLAYLGAGVSPEQLEAASRVVGRLASIWAPVEGQIGGVGRFTPEGQPSVHVALFDAPGLGALREALVDALVRAGVTVSQSHGFTPHITLTYGDDPQVELQPLEVSIGELTLAMGPLRIPFRLGGSETGVDQVAVAKELRRWRDNARKRVAKGMSARPFVSSLLLPSTTAEVWAQLSEASNRDQVDAAFAEQLRQ